VSAAGFLGPLIASTLRARSKRHSRAFGFLAGGRRSFLDSSNLLALGGLGWAAYEIWRSSQRSASASAGAPTVVPGTVVEGDLPPPLPTRASASKAPQVQGEVQRIVDLTLAAARADGELSEDEYAAILQTAREIDAEALVRPALDRPRPLGAIVADVSERKQRESLYVYAFGIVRADEDVSAAERTWLQQLAGHLGLDSATVTRLERDTASRIAGMPAGRQQA
jgi:uncharacterized membrane protein YebE (DUF533 family)